MRRAPEERAARTLPLELAHVADLPDVGFAVVFEVVARPVGAHAVDAVAEILTADAVVPGLAVLAGRGAARRGLHLRRAVAEPGVEVGVRRQRQEADAIDRRLVLELDVGADAGRDVDG